MKRKNKWLIVANWKMNPSSKKLAKNILTKVKKNTSRLSRVETVVCPPFVYMLEVKTTTRFILGSQDMFWEPEGSFTGYVSNLQLKDMGVKYSIIGHSERRALGESDIEINKKIKVSISSNITPIVCVGEKERNGNGDHFAFIREQIESAFAGVSKSVIKDVVIAYEPVWAIGKNAKRSASTGEIFEMTIFIKKVLSDIYQTKSVPSTRVLYGGSTNDKNIEDILKNGGVDGVLVGGASLDPLIFGNMLKIAEKIK